MQKPLTYHSQGFASRKLNSILAQTLPTNQLFLLIQSHRLTEVLEALESVGITGDLAILFIASLQILEVGA
ncbi:MAG: hypothetical protein ACYTXE_42185 [Nostoc sp.]